MVDAVTASPDDPPEKILEKITEGALEGVDHGDVSFAIQPLAALLIRLSRDAEATAQTVERLTRRLYWLTVGLLILTFLLLAKELLDVYKNKRLPNPTSSQAEQVQQVEPYAELFVE